MTSYITFYKKDFLFNIAKHFFLKLTSVASFFINLEKKSI